MNATLFVGRSYRGLARPSSQRRQPRRRRQRGDRRRRVAERFSPPRNEIERLNYGFSILHCLAVGMLDDDSAGTGTVIRPDTVRRYAAEAGFNGVDVLPIEHDFWRFYRLVP